jgi:hypothetical protein
MNRTSVGPTWAHHDHIAIGVVGGLELDGTMKANETLEQEEALEELMQALADTLNVPLEVTDQREWLQNRRDQDEPVDHAHEGDDDEELEEQINCSLTQ